MSVATIPRPWPEFADLVVSLYTPPLRAASTAQRMRWLLRYLEERLEVRSTADLTTRLVTAYVASRREEVRTNTILGELGYLKALAAIAVEEGCLSRSPFDSKRLKLRAEPPRAKPWHGLTDVAVVLAYLESRRRFSWADHRLFAVASTVALTGLRRNEALRLQAGDVDLAAGVLAVVARHRLKTEASAQPVPMPPKLVEVLGEWLPETESVWLFPTLDRSAPWTGGNPGTKPLDRLKAAGRAVGVEGLTWQSLRHSYATHAESAWGLAEGVTQRVLRHTRPLTTRGYRHADVMNLRNAVASVRYAIEETGPGSGSSSASA